MSLLLINIMLALIWIALTGYFTPGNFLFGFILGYIAILISRPLPNAPGYLARFPKIIVFFLQFTWEVVKANLRVGYDVLTPTHNMRPGVISFKMNAKEDYEITLLMNLISLTPGTLSLDISRDRRILYIHAMYIDDLEGLRKELRLFEKRLLEAIR